MNPTSRPARPISLMAALVFESQILYPNVVFGMRLCALQKVRLEGCICYGKPSGRDADICRSGVSPSRLDFRSLKRFPHLQSNDDGSKFSDSCQVCWRTMRWHNGRSRRSRNLHSENAYQGSETKKDEGAAHSIQARRSLLQQRPDTFAQTNSVILFFACNTAADHTFRVVGNTEETRLVTFYVVVPH